METHTDGSPNWLSDFHAGRREAFEALYRDHFSTVSRSVGRVVRGADQQTVVQDVFFKLMTSQKARRSFREGSFAAWLTRLSRNYAVDFRRRRAREEPAGLELQEAGVQFATPTADVEMSALERIALARCRSMPLPEKWERIFDARFVECLTQGEAARRLGMSRTTLADEETRICKHLRGLVTGAAQRHRGCCFVRP